MILLLLACTPESHDVVDPPEADSPAEPDTEPADTAAEDTATIPADAWAYLRGPTTEDEDGDGRWEAGEWLRIDVVLQSVSDGMLSGIGARGELVDAAEGTMSPDSCYFFGIHPRGSEEISLAALPAPGLPEGTVVGFRLSVDTDNCATIPEQCPPPFSLVVERTLGE